MNQRHLVNRRGFLGLLAGGAAVAADPERALWVPGRKLISIPKPVIHQLPELPLPELVWRGDKPEDLGDPASIVASGRWWLENASPAERLNAIEFYSGLQWPDAVIKDRGRRPAYVVNRILPLVQAVIAKYGMPTSPQVYQDMICVIARRNMVPQQIYNYVASARVEIMALRTPVRYFAARS